jgi:hypothetical protein
MLEPCPPALLALVIFEIGSHFMPGLAWTVILPFMLPCRAKMTGGCHHIPLLLVEMGSQKFFTQAGLKV